MNRSLVVEFIGTFFLCLLATSGAGALAIGVGLAAMIYAGGYISGAHYNPAVTIAAYVRGRITTGDGLKYLLAQAAGFVACVMVGLILNGLLPSPEIPKISVEFKSWIRAFFGEVIGAFALAYVVMSVATTKGNSPNQFYGAAIGLTVTAMAGVFSASFFNPAVAFSAVLLQKAHWSLLFSCLIGAPLGAIGAGLVVNYLNQENGRSLSDLVKSSAPAESSDATPPPPTP